MINMLSTEDSTVGLFPNRLLIKICMINMLSTDDSIRVHLMLSTDDNIRGPSLNDVARIQIEMKCCLVHSCSQA